MHILQWATVAGLLIWLVGVGLLAHAFAALVEDEMPDYIRIGISLFAERIAVVAALVIVSWPLSMPCLWIMWKNKRRKV